MVETESEFHGLREKLKHEEAAVGHLRGTVVSSEAVRSELFERLNAHARLDALREQSMHQVKGELRKAVSGFRASEMKSEREQFRVYLLWAQELAGVQQQIAEKAAMVSHAEQWVNEEHAAISQQRQIQDHEVQQELD